MIIFALLTCSRNSIKKFNDHATFTNVWLHANTQCNNIVISKKVLKQVRKQFKTFNRNQSRRY